MGCITSSPVQEQQQEDKNQSSDSFSKLESSFFYDFDNNDRQLVSHIEWKSIEQLAQFNSCTPQLFKTEWLYKVLSVVDSISITKSKSQYTCTFSKNNAQVQITVDNLFPDEMHDHKHMINVFGIDKWRNMLIVEKVRNQQAINLLPLLNQTCCFFFIKIYIVTIYRPMPRCTRVTRPLNMVKLVKHGQTCLVVFV